jgi:VanZ family protein
METFMKIKYFSWLPAALIMVAIFLFSARPADSSNESSMAIVTQIMNLYQDITKVPYEPEEKIQVEEILNHLVRKSAHFCEYAILAVSIAFHLFVLRRRGMPLFLLPVFTVFLYAALDEFHQTFVPGRSGLFQDVLLDTAGGTIGSLIFSLIVLYLLGRLKRKQTGLTV